MSKTDQNVRNDVLCTVYKSTLSSQRKINIKPDEKTFKNATNKLTYSNHGEKGKNLNKVEAKKISSGGRTKEKRSKCVIDFGVNTLISGPKLCDSNCVTNSKSVGSRQCKCGRKVVFKTVDNYTQYIETLNCSTQCPNKCSITTDTNIPCDTHKQLATGRPITLKYPNTKEPGASFVIYEKPTPKSIYKPKYPVHLAVNRWAITRHPVRGPDF